MDERELEGTGADETGLSEVQHRAAYAEVSDRSLQIRIAGAGGGSAIPQATRYLRHSAVSRNVHRIFNMYPALLYRAEC